VRLNKYDEALADEDQAIALRPSEASYYFNRGNIYFMTLRNPEARDDFDRAIAASSVANPTYFEKRRLVYLRLGLGQEALADLKHAQALRSAPPQP